MSRITNKQLTLKLRELERILKDTYPLTFEEKKRDWRTYEQQYMERLKKAMRHLDPLLTQATVTIVRAHKRGDDPKLDSKQKASLLLTKQFVQKSNRVMSAMLCLFSMLSGIDVSYKTIERLYSDDEVEMALHNLHMLLLQQRGVKSSHSSGDATGYSLTVRKHYASEVRKLKEKAKKHDERKKKRSFVYNFMLMDLRTRMYVAYGTSFKSEKEAFDNAMNMLSNLDITLESVRLDKYYSAQLYVDRFSKSKVYIIPKSNATIRGSPHWKETLRAFIEDTLNFLHEYYQRNNSESGFSADKKLMGWKVGQKREDRIDIAIRSTMVWHNLLCI